MTQVGPIEVMVVAFPGSKFNGSIAPALQAVVDKGDIAIIDFAFITKGEDGSVSVIEIEEIDTDSLSGFDAVAGELLDLLNEQDLALLGESLDPGSSAAALVFEHTWARELAAAVSSTEGEVIFSERVPRDVVAAAIVAAS